MKFGENEKGLLWVLKEEGVWVVLGLVQGAGLKEEGEKEGEVGVKTARGGRRGRWWCFVLRELGGRKKRGEYDGREGEQLRGQGRKMVGVEEGRGRGV